MISICLLNDANGRHQKLTSLKRLYVHVLCNSFEFGFSDLFAHHVTRREQCSVCTEGAAELDRTGNFGNALTAQNINTFSAMAFALGTPQTPPTDQQFDTLAQTVFGGGFTLGQASLLRRLHFESTTLMIASVKQRVDGEASDRPDSVKRIPVAEKRYRLGTAGTETGGHSHLR